MFAFGYEIVLFGRKIDNKVFLFIEESHFFHRRLGGACLDDLAIK
jgi:hypothetical protein